MKKRFVRAVAFFGYAAVIALAVPAEAAGTKPRFLIIVDTSGSMSLTPGGTETRGDGSARHPGCNVDGYAAFDGSRLYQAKQALNDTISAFGVAEFALARYKATDINQRCTVGKDANGDGINDDCAGLADPTNYGCIDPTDVPGTDTFCAVNRGWGCNSGWPGRADSLCYAECGVTSGTCCTNRKPGIATPDPRDIYTKGLECPTSSDCVYPTCDGADVVVGFPSGGSNYDSLLSWLDGVETFPAGNNRELRANGATPLAGSLAAALHWLTDASKTSVGAGAGLLSSTLGARDAKAACRSYNVILITDGVENCDVRASGANTEDRAAGASAAAAALRAAGVKTYVIGFAVNDSTLNTIAAAGGTSAALLANDRAQLTARLGDIITASIPTPTCDCDGTCDDEDGVFTQKGRPCTVGVGRCKRTGAFACSPDGTGVRCTDPAGLVCSGSALTPGAPVTEVCGAAPGCPASLSAEDCADDDCDGQIDEGLNCACALKPEICNGKDDNCNGQIDEGIAQVACGLDIGACKAGLTRCDNGTTGCVGATGPSAEVCDNQDNDCDGITDGFGDGCFPTAPVGCAFSVGSGQWTCLGVCQPGVRTCTAGTFGACTGATLPSPELPCDGLDNDCDGQVDEGFGLGQACGPGTSGVGACRPGIFACEAGRVVCAGGLGPTEEICDGKDNDCDGVIDGPLGPCGEARGDCEPGQYQCQGSTLVCVQGKGPTPEICDNRDNDCNGLIDDGLSEDIFKTPTPCSANVGICRAGVWKCVAGQPFCEGGVLPTLEVCNALDDDCDGCIDCDEGCLGNLGKACTVPGSGQACGFDVGECRPGALFCVTGMIRCVGATAPRPELCDGKDNNCDGFTDEADPELGTRCFPAGASGCDVSLNACEGECRFGARICQAQGNGATLGCVNPVTPVTEICDGRDNDCNGRTDEIFDVGTVCDNAAPGKCFAVGTKICNGRGDGTTCSVQAPDIADEICDGRDNDCDDKVDTEDTDKPLPGVGLPCGSDVGECVAGITTCTEGKIACTGKDPTPEICDGLDNDCDGSVDEDLTPPGPECVPPGLPAGSALKGECRAGKYACAKGQDGLWGWQCREGTGPTPEICDGKDNDCDGMADDMAECPVPFQCIEGECAPPCSDDEFSCTADRICKEGFCVNNRCANVRCPPSSVCDPTGNCVDRCLGVSCAPEFRCFNGLCFDCQTTGCPAGQVCRVHSCEVDKCEGVACGDDAYCRAGRCVRDCFGVVCPAGKSCREGTCVPDACAGVVCANGEFCNPTTGACQANGCLLLQCMPGLRCVKTLNACQPDPCLDLRCPGGTQCDLTPDGFPQCVLPPNAPPNLARPQNEKIATSGGGLATCTCRVGGVNAPEGGSGAALLWLVGAASVLGMRRRTRHKALTRKERL